MGNSDTARKELREAFERLRCCTADCTGLSGNDRKVLDECRMDLEIAMGDVLLAILSPRDDAGDVRLASFEHMAAMFRDVAMRFTTSADRDLVRRTMIAALEHAESRARRSESLWDAAARSVQARETPPVGVPVRSVRSGVVEIDLSNMEP